MRISIVSTAFLVTLSAFAQDPAKSQRIFNVKINVTPSRVLPIDAKKVHGDVPVSVLTDSEDHIVGIQVGSESRPKILFDMKDGSVMETYVPAMVASTEALKSKNYLVQVQAPVVGSRDLFYVDGRRLDSVRGGPIAIKYMANPLLGTTNDITLDVKRVNGRWVASNEDGKLVDSAEIRSTFTGMGLADPRYGAELDPNRLVGQMAVQPISDPRQASNLMKQGEQMLDFFEKNPVPLAVGATMSLRTESGAR